VPAWAPVIHIGPAADSQPAAESPAQTAPAKPLAAEQPVPAAAAPTPPASVPTAPTAATPIPGPNAPVEHPSWQVVEQKHFEVAITRAEPTADDRAYAEWFAWAKRGGAKAPACHAAAQGAFRALASGHDIATAVKWATAAMASPPVAVDNARQAYCAWFSLANIDMQLDTARAHLFATGALKALDAGANPAQAHNAGAAAAGLRRA
jgi:hypothetical protein